MRYTKFVLIFTNDMEFRCDLLLYLRGTYLGKAIYVHIINPDVYLPFSLIEFQSQKLTNNKLSSY